LKPDLFAITANGDFEDHWYIEVDRATESVPTLLRKCGQYEAYRRSGIDQQTHGVFPVVAWLVPSEPRAKKLQAAIRASRHLDRNLFRVATADRFLDLVHGAAG
jgi:hypothetical protein